MNIRFSAYGVTELKGLKPYLSQKGRVLNVPLKIVSEEGDAITVSYDTYAREGETKQFMRDGRTLEHTFTVSQQLVPGRAFYENTNPVNVQVVSLNQLCLA